MAKIFIRAAFLGSLIVAGCTNNTHEDRNLSAANIPSHVATEANSNSTISAESGDVVTIRLKEAKNDSVWRIKSSDGLAIIGSSEGAIESDNKERVRVFNFQTQIVGHYSPEFSKTEDDKSDLLKFKVHVR